MKNQSTRGYLNPNKQTSRIIFILMFCFVLMLPGMAQTSVIPSEQNNNLTGKITDAETGAALGSVTIQIMQVKDTPVVGTISLKDGSYSVPLQEGAKTIIISISGYKTLLIDILNRTVIDVAMSKNTAAEEDPSWGL